MCSVDWTFDSGATGATPACWTCGPGKTTGTYKDWGAAYVDDGSTLSQHDRTQLSLPSGSKFLYMGFDEGTGTCVSNLFPLPAGIAMINWYQAGGADRPSGLYLFKEDGTALCSPQAEFGNSNTFRSQTCNGLKGKDSELVYFSIQDSTNGGWGQVYIDNITFASEQSNVVAAQALAVTHTTILKPKTAAEMCLRGVCSSQIGAGGTCSLTSDASAFQTYTWSQSKAYAIHPEECCPAAASLSVCVTANCHNVATADALAWRFFSLLPSLCACYSACPAIKEYISIAADMESAEKKAMQLLGDSSKVALLCGTGGFQCLNSTMECRTLAENYYPMSKVYDQLTKFMPLIQCPSKPRNYSDIGITNAATRDFVGTFVLVIMACAAPVSW